MKVIEAIINTANLDEVRIALQHVGIEKIMVSHLGRSAVLHKGAEYMVGFMSKIKVEILTADELVGRVIETIGEIARRERRGVYRIMIHPFSEAAILNT